LKFRLLCTGVVEMEFVIDCGNRGPIGVVREGRKYFRDIDGSNLWYYHMMRTQILGALITHST
jgi:hypothetical protein